jgi:hypothetical protein
MRGVGQTDAIESVTFRHEEGNERGKIGVERRNGAFYGCKLLKKKEEVETHREFRLGFMVSPVWREELLRKEWRRNNRAHLLPRGFEQWVGFGLRLKS